MKTSNTRLLFSTIINLVGAILLLATVAGCSGFGPSTVELSRATTVRVKDLHQIHQAAINQYFDFQEVRVEEFIEREWAPLFLRNFLGNSGIIIDINSASRVSKQAQLEISEAVKSYLDDDSESDQLTGEIAAKLTTSRGGETSIVEQVIKKFIDDDKVPGAVAHVMALLGTDEAAILIMEFAKEAHNQIDIQRKKMLKPIKKKREEVLLSINDRYDEVLAAQGMITGRLEAEYKQDQANSALVDSVFGEGSDQAIRGELLSFGDKVSGVLTQLSSVLGDESDLGADGFNKKLIDIVKNGMAGVTDGNNQPIQ